MINMSRNCKIIQCLTCSKFSHLIAGSHQISFLQANSKIPLNKLEAAFEIRTKDTPRRAQEPQNIINKIKKPDFPLQPAEQLLQILRSNHSETPKWLPIYQIFHRAIETGLLPEQIQEVIDLLKTEGFLEIREDKIRIIPID